MSKKINEASVKVDLTDFSTDDMTSLSDIFRLAGMISTDDNVSPEVDVQPVQSTQTTPPPVTSNGFVDLSDEFDSVENEPIDTPDEELPVVDNEIGQDDPIAVPAENLPVVIDKPVDTDAGTDFIDSTSDELTPDEEDADQPDNDFDIDRLAELAGLQDIQRDDPMFESTDRILPDLSLNEFDDADDESHGPFSTTEDAAFDAQEQTGGVEGDHFVVTKTDNGFYWERTLGESCPEPEVVDTSAITDPVYQTHPKRTHPGDNKMMEPDLAETFDTIYESINDRFKTFFGK